MTESPVPVWIEVLLDWQNVYNCARDAFGLGGSRSVAGTVNPLQLARHLVGLVDPNGQLQAVRIYRGRPDNAKDSKGYSAWRSQTAAWESMMGNLLIPRYRDLRYRGPEVTEKGVDVWMAIDIARIAIEKSADRLVVVTSDTDLVPAVELAAEVRGSEFIHVAGWSGSYPSAALLAVDGVRRHQLNWTIYDRFKDETDYNLPARARRKQGWDAQINAEGRRRRQR